MILKSYLLSLATCFCFFLYQATYFFEDHIKEVFLLKYRLLHRPKLAMQTHCKPKKKNSLFNCQADYWWHQDKKWQKVCDTPRSRWFFPPRYYKIQMQCTIRDVPIRGLHSEWFLFY